MIRKGWPLSALRVVGAGQERGSSGHSSLM